MYDISYICLCVRYFIHFLIVSVRYIVHFLCRYPIYRKKCTIFRTWERVGWGATTPSPTPFPFSCTIFRTFTHIIHTKHTKYVMVQTKTNYNSNGVTTIFPPSPSNAITKEYYFHLIGEINKKVLRCAVCKVENLSFNTTDYYLLTTK